VPRGNPDGGQWTDDLRWLGGTVPAADTDRGELVEGMAADRLVGQAPLVLVQSRRRTHVPYVCINGQRTSLTPAQAVQLDILEALRMVAVAQARAIQPGWRPRPSAYGDPAGLIAARRWEIEQAREFTAGRGHTASGPQEALAEVLAPQGVPRGSRGATDEIYVVRKLRCWTSSAALRAKRAEFPHQRDTQVKSSSYRMGIGSAYVGANNTGRLSTSCGTRPVALHHITNSIGEDRRADKSSTSYVWNKHFEVYS
jgi:hypothetical protein